jgi:hypothetical protein
MVDGQALASQNRSFAKKLLQKTEVVCKFQNKRYLQIAAKERYLKFASNFSHSHNCVTLTFV